MIPPTWYQYKRLIEEYSMIVQNKGWTPNFMLMADYDYKTGREEVDLIISNGTEHKAHLFAETLEDVAGLLKREIKNEESN